MAGASLLLGEVQKVDAPFWPPRARKTAETAHFGPSAGRTESTAATPPKFRSFYPLELFGLIHKRPGYDPFFAKNPFSPADEFVFMGLVVRSCYFDVTACAEARRLAQRAFQSFGPAGALRAPAGQGWGRGLKLFGLFLKFHTFWQIQASLRMNLKKEII